MNNKLANSVTPHKGKMSNMIDVTEFTSLSYNFRVYRCTAIDTALNYRIKQDKPLPC